MDNIRLAKKQDIPALCEIWKHCFQDSEEYIRFFYERNFERIQVLAYYADNKPVSMIHLINASFESGEKCQNAKLIYAVGTLPKWRNNGCMGALLSALTKSSKEEGFALFLKPSSPSLFEYYAKFGFVKASSFRLVKFAAGKMQNISCRELSAEEYNKMRENAFCSIPHVKWDNAHILWCIEENELFSGRTLRINYDNRDYFIMAYPENETLVINETDLSLKQLKAIGGFLCSVFKTEKLEAYLCPQTCREGEKTVSNLVYNSEIENPYINLIMI